jgi:hypothetical protein
MTSEFEDCVQGIDKLMKYDEKLASGIIQQVWCLDSFETELHRILTGFTSTITNIHEENFSKTFDVEFESIAEATRFRNIVSMNRQLRVYTNRINMLGKLYPKPNIEEVKRKKEFLIKENCNSIRDQRKHSV